MCIGMLRNSSSRAIGRPDGFHSLQFVDHDALQHVDVALPRLFRQHALAMLVSGLPAGADACAGEVDVLGVVLAVEPRRKQPDQVHDRAAAIGGEFLDHRIVAPVFGNVLHQFAHDVAQTMQLLLPGDVAFAAAGKLKVLLPAHHLPDRFAARGRWAATC